jgi:hypothetical protein
MLLTHQIQELLKIMDEPRSSSSSVSQDRKTSLSKNKSKLDYARHRHKSFDTATTIPFNSSERSETLPYRSADAMNSSLRSSAVDNLHDFLTASVRESKVSNFVGTGQSVTGYQDKPIAELFPCTTLSKFHSSIQYIYRTKSEQVDLQIYLPCRYSVRRHRWLHRVEFYTGTTPGFHFAG